MHLPFRHCNPTQKRAGAPCLSPYPTAGHGSARRSSTIQRKPPCPQTPFPRSLPETTSEGMEFRGSAETENRVQGKKAGAGKSGKNGRAAMGMARLKNRAVKPAGAQCKGTRALILNREALDQPAKPASRPRWWRTSHAGRGFTFPRGALPPAGTRAAGPGLACTLVSGLQAGLLISCGSDVTTPEGEAAPAPGAAGIFCLAVESPAPAAPPKCGGWEINYVQRTLNE
jgi:hypothetical protein